MMKKLLFTLLFSSSFTCSAATILNLMDFDGSEAQKKQVIDFITSTVKKDYCDKIDMCNYGTIWMMYKKNSEAKSKNLTW